MPPLAPIAPITAPPSSVIGSAPIWGVKRPPVAALIEALKACSSFIFSPCAALGGEDGRELLLCSAPDFIEANRKDVREAVLLTTTVDVGGKA